MITAGQRSGQKHLASFPGPSRLTTRMKRIGRLNWNSCMSMHGELGRKSKTKTAWGPLRTSWDSVKGKWGNGEVFLCHSWLKIQTSIWQDASKEEMLKSKTSATGLSVVKTGFAASRQQDWKKKSAVHWSQVFYITDTSIIIVNLRFSERISRTHFGFCNFTPPSTDWDFNCFVHQTTWGMWQSTSHNSESLASVSQCTPHTHDMWHVRRQRTGFT